MLKLFFFLFFGRQNPRTQHRCRRRCVRVLLHVMRGFCSCASARLTLKLKRERTQQKKHQLDIKSFGAVPICARSRNKYTHKHGHALFTNRRPDATPPCQQRTGARSGRATALVEQRRARGEWCDTDSIGQCVKHHCRARRDMLMADLRLE